MEFVVEIIFAIEGNGMCPGMIKLLKCLYTLNSLLGGGGGGGAIAQGLICGAQVLP